MAKIKSKPSNVSWQLARIRSGGSYRRVRGGEASAFVRFAGDRSPRPIGGPGEPWMTDLSLLTGGRVPFALPIAPAPR